MYNTRNVPTLSPTRTSDISKSSNGAANTTQSLSQDETIGIIIGVIFGVLFLGAGFFWYRGQVSKDHIPERDVSMANMDHLKNTTHEAYDAEDTMSPMGSKSGRNIIDVIPAQAKHPLDPNNRRL